MKDIRILFNKKYGPLEKSIGIFGKYGSDINTIEGKISGINLIKKMGYSFAERSFITITGEGIFIKKNNKIKKCEYLTKKVRRWVMSSRESLWDFSRCLASIPLYALFVLTDDRSSSEN